MNIEEKKFIWQIQTDREMKKKQFKSEFFISSLDFIMQFKTMNTGHYVIIV